VIFLHDEHEEKIYMHQPEGKEDHACRVKKSLYDLK